VRNEGLGSWPGRRARMTPAATALVCDGQCWSYGEFSSLVTSAAHRLRGLGVRPGDRVAYLGRNLPGLPLVLFAAGLLGAVFVPLNFRLAAPELAVILDDCEPRVLIWDEEFAGTVTAATCITAGELSGGDGEPLDVPVGLDDLCMIQYTSGTSGRPKGVQLTHANVTWNCFNVMIDVDIASDEVSLVSAPLFHTAALNQLFLPTFLKGGTSVLMAAFDPARALELIEEYRVTWMFGVPAMFAAMTRAAGWATADLSSLRVLMCGGAPVPTPLIGAYQRRGLTFAQGYGLTESSPGALFLRAAQSVSKAGSAGTPCFFTDVRVLGPGDAPVAAGETGEIVVCGPNVTPGYWNQAPLSGWLRTGDAATVDSDGYVFIRGRTKDMFISGGENIYPAEIEQVLLRHPAVVDCAVLGVPDPQWGEVGRAVVVPRAGTTVVMEEILTFLDGKLARYKIPRSVVFADELPRNAAGKILKARLNELYGRT
jgi:fatty-acyl-CoA synthase